jgi:hypothetical protein
MSVPVEQLEIAIPQGYGLFIKTVFQTSSFIEPLELHFQVQVDYLASSPSCGQPPARLASHGKKFLFPTWRLNLHVVIRQFGHLHRFGQFWKEMSFLFYW